MGFKLIGLGLELEFGKGFGTGLKLRDECRKVTVKK